MLWRLMPVLAAALIIGGAAYIVVRTHRFGFLRALAQRHKLLSWLLALIPVGLVGLFGLAFNITTVAVVFLHLLLAWLVCDGVWLLVRLCRKKPVQHYWAGADLVISGHTHGGHIFPAGQIGLALHINDSIYGVQRRGGTDFLVTSGVSGWAIPFKTGCISEFVIIDITEE